MCIKSKIAIHWKSSISASTLPWNCFKLSRAEFRSLIHHFSVTYLSIVENCDQAENFIYFKNPDTPKSLWNNNSYKSKAWNKPSNLILQTCNVTMLENPCLTVSSQRFNFKPLFSKKLTSYIFYLSHVVFEMLWTHHFESPCCLCNALILV